MIYKLNSTSLLPYFLSCEPLKRSPARATQLTRKGLGLVHVPPVTCLPVTMPPSLSSCPQERMPFKERSALNFQVLRLYTYVVIRNRLFYTLLIPLYILIQVFKTKKTIK
jgi:hypothetical protein